MGNMIDSREASEALADINEMTRRVRQSRIYNLASLMLIMWGTLVFAGYLGAFLAPRQAGYFWAALNAAGVAGSFAISAAGYRKTGIRTFDFRMLIAFVLFFGLIAEVGPVRATVVAYVNPAVAVALGVAVLGEPLTAGTAVGFALILAGSWLATGTRLPRAAPAPALAGAGGSR